MAQILTIASLLVVAITLIVNTVQARSQVKQTKELARTNHALLYQSLTGTMEGITREFLTYPELRPYFYDNKQLPADQMTRDRAMSLAEMYVDFMSFTLNRDIFFNGDNRLGWTGYFRFLAANSSAIRKYWMSSRQWYEPPIWAALNDEIERITFQERAELSPMPSEDPDAERVSQQS